MGKGKVEGPASFGAKGNISGGPQPAGGKLVSPNKSTAKSEASGHSAEVKS